MAKAHSLWCGLFYTPIQYVFTLALGRAVLYENVALSFVVIWTKKRYSSFLWNVLVFRKTCFKVNVLKKLKIPSGCYIKTCQSLKGATKSYFTHYSCVVIVLFERVYVSAFSMVSFRKLVFCLSVLPLCFESRICVIMLCNFDMLCNFVLTYIKNSPFIKI